MNYLKQFLIILSISFIGEILKAALPLPVPASIYGMADSPNIVLIIICAKTNKVIGERH